MDYVQVHEATEYGRHQDWPKTVGRMSFGGVDWCTPLVLDAVVQSRTSGGHRHQLGLSCPLKGLSGYARKRRPPQPYLKPTGTSPGITLRGVHPRPWAPDCG